MKAFAPILLFTYKRLDTLIRCLDSLKKCPEAMYSDLIIVSDHQAYDLDADKVAAVRLYLKSLTGFKTIEILERERNYGVDNNIIEGIKYMATRFPQFIVVEDDLVVKNGFLTFLNLSLNYYKNYAEVLTVTGFSYLHKIPTNYLFDMYFAKRTHPWGWATWAEKINKVDWEVADKEQFLKSPSIQRKFNEWGSDRSRMLTKVLTKKLRTWDIQLDYDQFKNNGTTVYPLNSFVENIGFDSLDASHTFGYNRFKTKNKLMSIDLENIRFSKSVIYNSRIIKDFINKNSITQRIITRIIKFIGYKN